MFYTEPLRFEIEDQFLNFYFSYSDASTQLPAARTKY